MEDSQLLQQLDISFRGPDSRLSLDLKSSIDLSHNESLDSVHYSNGPTQHSSNLSRLRTQSGADYRRVSSDSNKATIIGKHRGSGKDFLQPNEDDQAQAGESTDSWIPMMFAKKRSESMKQERPSSSFNMNSIEIQELRKNASKSRLREALIKKMSTPVKETYFNLASTNHIKPKRLNFDEVTNTPANPVSQAHRGPVKLIRNHVRGGEVKCCASCNSLKDVFFK
mmetsp:Transcript_7330/g.13572  ORF Transcript_7330/g.13572 Transcript_7330/m.13572 type:complete len:225 (+) Transcript_7330:62-736(+)